MSFIRFLEQQFSNYCFFNLLINYTLYIFTMYTFTDVTLKNKHILSCYQETTMANVKKFDKFTAL